jgi:hypothetical protein
MLTFNVWREAMLPADDMLKRQAAPWIMKYWSGSEKDNVDDCGTDARQRHGAGQGP